MDYPIGRFIGHVMPIDVIVYQSENTLFRTGLVPIEVNAPFSTYVSLIPPNMFYTVFRHSAAPQISWDKLRIEPRAADWAGIAPSSIHLQGLGCVTL
jgi:hypothetical protein